MLKSKAALLVFLGAIMISAATCTADVTLPHVVGSNMVLQRDLAAPVWGWAAPGEEVTVSIAGQEAKATADAQGRWKVKLAPMKAGGPFDMTVRGKNEIKLQNVLVGDVWLCSGQSNMKWELLSASTGRQALAKADLPKIRLFYVPNRAAGQPVADVASDWKVCSAKTAERFSAVAFFFGRELNKELDVPIGLIDSSWSGVRIDPWIAPEGFASIPEYPDMTERFARFRERWKAEMLPRVMKKGPEAAALQEALEKSTPMPIKPEWIADAKDWIGAVGYTGGLESEIYNGMIYPLAPFGLRGVIWYQGESNTYTWPLIDYALPDGGMTYVTKTRALINGWQKVWGQGELPLYFVQIAPNSGYADETLPRFWEQQLTILREVKNTGMAVTTDIGVKENIHPPNKEDVGKRLALWALAKTYGKDVVFSGPIYKAMSVEGNKIRLRFDYVGGGFASRDSKPLDWFTIAGADHKFVPAQAEIDGETLVVSSDQVAAPLAVRFAWDKLAMPNFMNKAGLPASPFRTDRWDPPVPPKKGAGEAANEASVFLAENAKKPGVNTLPGGVQYEVLKEGDGPIPKLENAVSVVFTGRLIDGTQFDAAPASDPATPLMSVVMPWVQDALLKMKVGSKWRVVVPPNRAYGTHGFGPLIGPNAVLIYELELQKILK